MSAEREAVTVPSSGHAATTAADAPAADAPVVLAVRDLRKRYGDLEAVQGVSFEIPEGETYGLLGPNGAGQDHHHLDGLRPARRATPAR